MIPFDSFLLDPPLLVAAGSLARRLVRRLPEERREAALRAVGASTIAAFWLTSVSLYLNRPWTRWISEMCRAESGRDWMLNSGVFRFEHERPGAGTHVAAAAILATYPAWFALGARGIRGAVD